MKRILSVLATCLFLVAFVQTAAAAPSVTGEFDLPGMPDQLAAGPDGFIWVIVGGTNDFSRVAPDGTVTSYDATNLSNPVGVTAGPDGNMWFTQINGVVKISPSNPTQGEATTINAIGGAQEIVSDGTDLWTASGDKVVRVPPASPNTPQIFTINGLNARGIAVGSDGLIWIADFGSNRVFSLTTADVQTPYDLGANAGVQDVAAGPNGQVVIPRPGQQNIGLLSPGGTPTAFPTPAGDPFGATFGQDGAYWVAQFLSNDLGRLTPDGQYSVLGGLSANSGPRYVTTGPGNTLWVSLNQASKIARVSGVEPPAALTPTISGLKLTPSAFKVGKRATPVTVAAKRKYKTGTTISFNLSIAANVELVFNQILRGKRKGKKCVRPTRSLKRAKNCRRYRSVGKLNRAGVAGANKFKFSGRIGKRALKPGAYQLVVRATAPGGTTVASKGKTFRVVSGR